MYSAYKRISDARQSAYGIPFDDRSRFVIMSDCHRGNGDERVDNFARNYTTYYAALSHYNHEDFTYIELGDGDELWENVRLTEIMGMYKDVYNLMSKFYRDKRLIMVYGNHDYVKKDKEYIRKYYNSYFPGISVFESVLLVHSTLQGTIFLVHGHQADFLNDPLWKLARFLVRHFWRRLELIGVNDPTSAARNYKRRINVERKLVQWSDREKQMIIAGHTHRPVFPVRPGEYYFNDGCCVHSNGITAIEIVQGSIALVKWSAKTRRDGTLFVGKDVLEGPVRLDMYFDRILQGKQQSVPSRHRLT